MNQPTEKPKRKATRVRRVYFLLTPEYGIIRLFSCKEATQTKQRLIAQGFQITEDLEPNMKILRVNRVGNESTGTKGGAL